MIAVIGATGNTGRAVVTELRALGHDPICVVRNPPKAFGILGANTNVVVSDLSDRAALQGALRDVDRLFIVTGHSPDMVEQQNGVLGAALDAGVKYLVRVGGNAELTAPDSRSVVGRGHYAIEAALRASSMKWVILRPGLFMQNLLGQATSIRNEGKMFAAVQRDLPLALTDVRDTGAIGARILIDPEPYVGKIYEFTGAAVNYDECAKIFSEILGRPITYVQITSSQVEDSMKKRDLPDWLITHLLAINDLTNAGGLSRVKTDMINIVIGRPPLTMRQFVESYKSAFS